MVVDISSQLGIKTTILSVRKTQGRLNIKTEKCNSLSASRSERWAEYDSNTDIKYKVYEDT